MSKNTILVTGIKGQLGKKVKETFEKHNAYHMVYTDVDELDITSRKAVDEAFET